MLWDLSTSSFNFLTASFIERHSFPPTPTGPSGRTFDEMRASAVNIQIFGSAKSFDSKKAQRWFKERRVKYQYVDLPSKGLSPREYLSVKQKVGFDALVNTKCRAYEALYMAYITPDAREEKLLEHPELFNAPIVRNGREATVGYRPEVWQTWE
jgi:arsenate reductase-like glutaredoxin family protein